MTPMHATSIFIPYNRNTWLRKSLANRQNLPIGENLNRRLRLWVNHMSCKMVTHESNSCVKGFHVYGDIWTLFVGDTLACEQESGNPNDPYAVAIKKGSEVASGTRAKEFIRSVLVVFAAWGDYLLLNHRQLMMLLIGSATEWVADTL